MICDVNASTWPLRSTYALPANPSSAKLARQLTRGALQGCPGPLVETAELLVSELVGNAVRHASSAPVVRIDVADGSVRVAVQDDSSTLPATEEADPEADSGRGLLLVASLATSWGWSKTSGGKRVWFIL